MEVRDKSTTLDHHYQSAYQFEEVLVVTDDGAVGTGNQVLLRGAARHRARRRAQVQDYQKNSQIHFIFFPIKKSQRCVVYLRHRFTGFPSCLMMKM